jgi:hypothetical protein
MVCLFYYLIRAPYKVLDFIKIKIHFKGPSFRLGGKLVEDNLGEYRALYPLVIKIQISTMMIFPLDYCLFT